MSLCGTVVHVRHGKGVNDNAQLNGVLRSVAAGAVPFNNEVGVFTAFNGGYLGTASDNYSFYFSPIDLIGDSQNGSYIYDQFTRYADYFSTIDSLLGPPLEGVIFVHPNESGAEGRGNSELEAESENGTIPEQRRSSHDLLSVE